MSAEASLALAVRKTTVFFMPAGICPWGHRAFHAARTDWQVRRDDIKCEPLVRISAVASDAPLVVSVSMRRQDPEDRGGAVCRVLWIDCPKVDVVSFGEVYDDRLDFQCCVV